MSYTENPDIDAARWFDEEERKSLELAWLIEEEGKKECYNPFLIENIVEALCNLSDRDEKIMQDEFFKAQEYYQDYDKHAVSTSMVMEYSMLEIIEASEVHQQKRIIENVMKGKTND